VDKLVDRLVGGKGSDICALGSSRNDVIIEAAGLSNGIDTITSTISRSVAAARTPSTAGLAMTG
jgi:hypothetical protein